MKEALKMGLKTIKKTKRLDSKITYSQLFIVSFPLA